MLGLPALPKKLPSRNWLIFWTLSTSLAGAIIYDKREKKRATARWVRAVTPLARQPTRSPTELPRKITIYMECPPGDGLRVSQDHFIEYVKPVIAASGMDWDFVQGREEGDIRAAVAERIRRERKAVERPGEEDLPTDEQIVADLRKRGGIEEYEGIKGDLIVGRHTWKEYIRGLHEGWLGPLDPPKKPQALEQLEAQVQPDGDEPKDDGEGQEKKEGEEEPEKKEKKKTRPPQPPPYNTPTDYSSSSTPHQIPREFHPTVLIQHSHLLGFLSTHTRFMWFLNRRKLADDIGREAAAICFAAARDWDNGSTVSPEDLPQTKALEHEESYWPKHVWKDDPAPAAAAADDEAPKKEPKEKIWTAPMVTDPRIMSRMRKFETSSEDEAQARAIVVPEKDVEGWIKGSLREAWGWGRDQWKGTSWTPDVGDISKE